MANFLYNDVFYGVTYKNKKDLTDAASLATKLKDLLGEQFAEAIDRSDEKGRAVIYLRDKSRSLRLMISESILSVSTRLKDDESSENKANDIYSKALLLKVMESGIVGESFSMFLGSGTGYISVSDKASDNKRKTVNLCKSIFNIPLSEDINDFSLKLFAKRTYGELTFEYGVAETLATKVFALKLDVETTLNLKVVVEGKSGLEQLRVLLDQTDMIAELKNGSKKITGTK